MSARPRPVGVAERPPGDRPRERLAASGAGALSDAELLALVIRTGTAREGVLELAARVLADLLLDRRHRLVRAVVVGVGGIAHAPMEPREVLAAALREPGVAAVVVAHNHPSGDPAPSPEDRAVTRRLAAAAETVGLEFVDHLILAAGGWASLRERGEC